MNCCLAALRRHIRFASTSAVPLCLLLSACGGGGTGVANLPPPPPTPTPTPTPTASVEVKTSWLTSPATRVGKYDLIGRLLLTPGNGSPSSSRAVAPGEFTLNSTHPSANGPFHYTLNVPAGLLPGGISAVEVAGGMTGWTFNAGGPNFRDQYGDYTQYFGQNLKEYDVNSDGTEKLREDYDFTRGTTTSLQPLSPDKNLQTTLDYDIGYSYVAMGEWSWWVVDLNGAVAGDSGDLLFVNGDRTPASGIPVSGKATYDLRTLNGWVKVPFALTADFGQRTIATRIDQDYQYNPAGDSMDYPAAFGIHVGGSAPFSNDGLFNIPLSGTVNFSNSYAINTPQPPPAESATGLMNGAFFGPNAEQVGGTFFLDRSNGAQLFQDAFVGQQHKP